MIKPKDFNATMIFLLALGLCDACDHLSGSVSSINEMCLLAPLSVTLLALLLLVDRPSSSVFFLSICLPLGFYSLCLFLTGPVSFLGQFHLLQYLQLKLYSVNFRSFCLYDTKILW